MTDLDQLVLLTYGFPSVEAWKVSPFFGDMTAEEVMIKAGYKNAAEWEAAIMPLHREIQKETSDALMRLWYAIGKSCDPNQFRVYFETFDGYPPELLRVAVDRLIKSHRYTSIPTVAELVEACGMVAGDIAEGLRLQRENALNAMAVEKAMG